MGNKFERSFTEEITRGFRDLLEKKHLYQSITLVPPPQPTDKQDLSNAKLIQALTLAKGTWRPIFPVYGPEPEAFLGVRFQVPHAEMFCAKCDRRQPFNPDTLSEPSAGNSSYTLRRTSQGLLQIFSIAYICQGCKTNPEVVLIRREGYKLTLCGRAPMESFVTPKSIPKIVDKYFSGAVIAFQSGQILSALFMLRTCIEQWVYSRYPACKADEALTLYMESLPDDFKSRFPSFSKIYTDLSGAMHAANDDEKIFNQAVNEIEEHFDARRLYKLP